MSLRIRIIQRIGGIRFSVNSTRMALEYHAMSRGYHFLSVFSVRCESRARLGNLCRVWLQQSSVSMAAEATAVFQIYCRDSVWGEWGKAGTRNTV